jgi:hypothetical protein
LACGLAALGCTQESTCARAFSHLMELPAIRGEVEYGLGADAVRVDSAYAKGFIARCEKNPPGVQACALQASSVAELNRCADVSALMAASALASMSPERRARLARDQGAAETHAHLKAVAIRIEALDVSKPGFVPLASTPLTPDTPCCSQPDQVCPVVAEQWQHQTWRALQFMPSEPFRFRYRIVSAGTGAASTVTVEAVGDPSCTGSVEKWIVGLSVDGQRLRRDNWDAVQVE